MRHVKRILLVVSEGGFLFFGLILSFTLGGVFDYIGGFILGSFAVFSGLFLTGYRLFKFRRKTRPWKIQYDATGYQLTRTERKLHPTRFKYKRLAKRVLIWIPTAIAAFVLFFYPLTTHLLHPTSHYLTHYRISIPWTASVFPSAWQIPNFVVSFFGSEATSEMSFRSLPPNSGIEPNREFAARMRERAIQVSSRELRVAGIVVTCWEYVYPYRGAYMHPLGTRLSPGLPEIDCTTPPDVRDLNFSAYFYGREEDIPAFYKIVEGMTPVK